MTWLKMADDARPYGTGATHHGSTRLVRPCCVPSWPGWETAAAEIIDIILAGD